MLAPLTDDIMGFRKECKKNENIQSEQFHVKTSTFNQDQHYFSKFLNFNSFSTFKIPFFKQEANISIVVALVHLTVQ